MADNISITVSQRNDSGTGNARRLRRSESIPGVIYGTKKEALNISVESRVLSQATQSDGFLSQVIDLEMDGKQQQVVVRDVQRHPATDRIIHVDFLRIDENQAITMAIPIRFLNERECVGVRIGGGSISRNLIEVEVNCLPRNLPDYIEVDLVDIDVGESVHLSDLTLPEGVTIAAFLQGESQDRDLPIASVAIQRVEIDEVEEELEEVEGEVDETEDEAETGEETTAEEREEE